MAGRQIPPDLPAASEELLGRYRSIRPATAAGGQRRPNKPLTLLWALGRAEAGAPRLISFADAEGPLTGLLQQFAPGQTDPYLAFWHLQSDRVWEVVAADGMLRYAPGRSRPTKGSMRVSAAGGLPADDHLLLRATPELLAEAAQVVLSEFFPETLHQPIADAVGVSIDAAPIIRRRRRSSTFRRSVLVAYQARCAVCDWAVRVGNAPLGIEAAHVFRHASGGSDEVDNGLALCAIHHLAWDTGALSADEERRIMVSPHVAEPSATDARLRPLRGHRLQDPQPDFPPPREDYLAWHRREVFRAA